jgi:hypothetical protein
MALDSIQPRGVCWQKNEFYIVFLAPRDYIVFLMRAEVIKYDIDLSLVKRSYIF